MQKFCFFEERTHESRVSDCGNFSNIWQQKPQASLMNRATDNAF